jgi:hypothetical protein
LWLKIMILPVCMGALSYSAQMCVVHKSGSEVTRTWLWWVTWSVATEFKKQKLLRNHLALAHPSFCKPRINPQGIQRTCSLVREPVIWRGETKEGMNSFDGAVQHGQGPPGIFPPPKDLDGNYHAAYVEMGRHRVEVSPGRDDISIATFAAVPYDTLCHCRGESGRGSSW